MGFDEDCRDIATSPEAVAELRMKAPLLAASAAPCGSQAVVKTLLPLVALYGAQNKSDAEWKAFWGFYIDVLGSLPLEALKAGVTEYVANSKSEFFPKPGPLKALCEPHAYPIRMAASRAKHVLKIVEAA